MKLIKFIMGKKFIFKFECIRYKVSKYLQKKKQIMKNNKCFFGLWLIKGYEYKERFFLSEISFYGEFEWHDTK